MAAFLLRIMIFWFLITRRHTRLNFEYRRGYRAVNIRIRRAMAYQTDRKVSQINTPTADPNTTLSTDNPNEG